MMNFTTKNTVINEKLHWNIEWIIAHTLDENLLEKADILKLHNDEIFVQHPNYVDYFVSQYGRVISRKYGRVILLKPYIIGPKNNQYLGYSFSSGEVESISVHRAVAEVFCPNFWRSKSQRKLNLQAHHIDGNHYNNDYRNLVLLPKKLHDELHKIKKLVLLKDGQIITYANVLDLVYDTGLTLEEIILSRHDKRRKPYKSSGYTVFNIKGCLIGYKYYPKKRKKKAAKKQS